MWPSWGYVRPSLCCGPGAWHAWLGDVWVCGHGSQVCGKFCLLPHSALHTLHFTLHTLQFTNSTLLTPHSTLLTLHSTIHTLHFTLLTPYSTLHCTLHTPDATLHTPHSTLYTPHSALYTPHSTLYTLYTPHSTLYTPHSLLYTPHSTLYTFHSALQTGNRGHTYKTVQINYGRKVLCVTAYPCVLTSVPLTYVWAFGFVGCILFITDIFISSLSLLYWGTCAQRGQARRMVPQRGVHHTSARVLEYVI